MADNLNPKAANAKEKRHNSYRLFYGIFLLGLGTTGFLISPYGHVEDIYVEGSEAVPEQGVIDSSSISSAQTVAGVLWDEERIEEDILTSWPKVKSAEVSRRGLNDITLAITEYETIAYLESKGGYRSILETGEHLGDGIQVPLGNKPVLTGFQDADKEMLLGLAKQLQALEDSVQNSISEIDLDAGESNPQTITVYMNDGNQVKAFLSQLGEKLAYYPAMASQLEGKKGIIDMEAGAYFTPFDKKEKTGTDGDTISETESSQELIPPDGE